MKKSFNDIQWRQKMYENSSEPTSTTENGETVTDVEYEEV